MKKRLVLLIFVITTVLLLSMSTVFANHEPMIRVGILSNSPSAVLGMNVKYEINDGYSGKRIMSLAPLQKTVVSYEKGCWWVNNKQIKSKSLQIKPQRAQEGVFIEVNRRMYRGTITMHPTRDKQGITVVNTLPFEQYLYGVIPREISPSWTPEVLKAQAVAARSYAWANFGRYDYDGYDVSAGTDSQAYGGASVEDSRTSAAVNLTKGLVITYNNKVVSAFFHSSSGGYTENSENVWGSYHGYLRGVKDFDQASPHYSWSKVFAASEVEFLLERNNIRIGKLQSISLSALTPQPVSSSDRGISGRVKELYLVGSAGTEKVTGIKLRSILSLHSALFDVKVMHQSPKGIKVPITDTYGDHTYKKIPINVKDSKGKTIVTADRQIHRITGRNNEVIVIEGYGWGHGLGMSQWGAKAMAESGPKNDPGYYKTILKHYYKGIEVQKMY